MAVEGGGKDQASIQPFDRNKQTNDCKIYCKRHTQMALTSNESNTLTAAAVVVVLTMMCRLLFVPFVLYWYRHHQAHCWMEKTTFRQQKTVQFVGWRDVWTCLLLSLSFVLSKQRMLLLAAVTPATTRRRRMPTTAATRAVADSVQPSSSSSWSTLLLFSTGL